MVDVCGATPARPTNFKQSQRGARMLIVLGPLLEMGKFRLLSGIT
jgi:hypothetical protein